MNLDFLFLGAESGMSLLWGDLGILKAAGNQVAMATAGPGAGGDVRVSLSLSLRYSVALESASSPLHPFPLGGLSSVVIAVVCADTARVSTLNICDNLVSKALQYIPLKICQPHGLSSQKGHLFDL